METAREYSGNDLASIKGVADSKIAFLFTGLGSQYPGMARGLYESQSIFKESLDSCAEILNAYLDISLFEILWPQDSANTLLERAQYAHPALFAVEYSLCQLWRSYGVKPDAVIGHSIGEYVAATIAGILSLEDGLKLIANQGNLVQGLRQNTGMLVVKADKKTVRHLLYVNPEWKIDIAAINSPSQTVVSGTLLELEEYSKACASLSIKTTLLKTSHAFHSHHIQPIIAELNEVSRSLQYHSPNITFISSVTANIAFDQDINSEYWQRNILEPVNFLGTMKTLETLGINVFIEIGPRPILTRLARDCLPTRHSIKFIPSLMKNTDDQTTLLNSLMELKNVHKQKVITPPKTTTELQVQSNLSELLEMDAGVVFHP